ncbi:DUF1707 domain-containing protein [Corynebacterium comes]|uniref:DUF1707 domain-containing protein n=1 Tax=Corynebacterium comes TaxID=2675218 RepID=A0A6B8VM39_9CORY|nr:DUF1707 domain-containing protein [Corynebacterium comes]QGU05113.1 hypothetical protein CETAM_09305 [Corynebacterium comes]
MNPSMNRPMQPRDEDREQLQADLTRLVGAGRLQFEEFDRLTEVVWSTRDKAVLDRIRAQYLTYHAPQAQPPQPVPMAQPGAQYVRPVEGQPAVSTMGNIRRTGTWTVPEYSVFRLTGSSLHLDLRLANAAAPVCTFEIQAAMSSIEIIVPPGVFVENRIKDLFSTVNIQTTQPLPGAPRVVLTGSIKGSGLSVQTKQAPSQNSLWNRLLGN